MATDPRQEMNYALVRHTDMKEEMRTEAVEVIVSSVEKYQNKYDLAVCPMPAAESDTC